jgi:allophanate hydrolase subunit 2
VGPPPPRAGDHLPVRPGGAVAAVALDEPDVPLPREGDVVTLDVVLGPRDDWFTPEAVRALTAQEWTVTPRSNRVGLRLRGEVPLERARAGELPSEGTVAGALQVPPEGHPVLFTADHPLTGGYPVIACVAAHHLDLAAQVPATGRLRFRVVGPDPGGTP